MKRTHRNPQYKQAYLKTEIDEKSEEKGSVLKDLKDKQKEAAAKPPVKDAAEKAENQKAEKYYKKRIVSACGDCHGTGTFLMGRNGDYSGRST